LVTATTTRAKNAGAALRPQDNKEHDGKKYDGGIECCTQFATASEGCCNCYAAGFEIFYKPACGDWAPIGTLRGVSSLMFEDLGLQRLP
jgi:hypothetical protein